MMERYPTEIGERNIPPGKVEEERLKHPRRGWLWLVVLVLLAIGVYFYARNHSGATPATTSGKSTGGHGRGGMVTPVVAAKAQKGDIGVYLTGLGTVTPIYTVTVKSRVDGELMKVYYREGDYIRQGDALVEIDPRPYQVALMQAQAQLAKDQATLDNAQVDLTRYQTLITHNAIPEQQVATQKALVEQDQAAIKGDQAAIASAKLNITYCHITAPITGRIGLRLVDPGNYVQASSQSGLLVITQIQPISVIFTITEDHVPTVLKKLRQGARLQVDAYSRDMKTKLASGSLTTVDNQIDPTTGTLRLRATFTNSNGSLFPNQFVNARLLVEEKHGVTLVPNAVVQRNTETAYVYMVKPDSTVTIKNVVAGTTEGGQTQITSGLMPGDVVVMTGVDKLQEGSKVRVHFENGTASKEE
jgi:membrane fusion protein, multidrug efflux system